jgi:hypothetical protein
VSHKRPNIYLVGGDVSVDSEASVVTSSFSRSNSPAQSFEGAHRDRVCVCVFIGMDVYACVYERLCCTMFLKKKYIIVCISH